MPHLGALGAARRTSVGSRTVPWVVPANISLPTAGGAYIVVFLIFSDHGLAGPHLFAGIAVGVLSCALAFAAPWSRLPEAAPMAVPLLGLLGLGVLTADRLPVALLTVFPVLTLARFHGPLGAVLGVLGGTVVAWMPMVTSREPLTTAQVPSVLLLPIVLVTIAVTISRMQRSRQARSRLLARRDGTLQRTLDDLADERALLEGIVESLPAGVLVLDGQRVVLANAQVERLYGPVDDEAEHPWRMRAARAAAADADGSGAAEAPDGAGEETSLAERAVAGESMTGQTQWWRAADGDRKAVRGTAVTLSAAAGRDPLRVVLFEDLTQEERAIEQREDFVRAVSHELRTPLTSVIGYLEMARDTGGFAADTDALLDVVDRNAQRVLGMVEDLAVASELKTERAAPLLSGGGSGGGGSAGVDLGEVARASVAGVCYAARVAGVSVGHACDGAWPVAGDAERLRLAVDHVVTNAVLYSHHGGSVDVALREGDGEVRLVVTDHGIGISEEDQERVFERFWRSPAVRGGSRHGTGLGLPVAREIVMEHGGRVTMRSRLGEGTQVEIVLPAREAGTVGAGRAA
ncbi:two-component sensor histidine kinase [Litorihabitans aurantiacus]|uniref:Sensor-like histidine kinase SenX3 n=1 Tax=Litorihabitans aurantiacus TaxID=1930061 RepID=A0AA37XAS3_9MICO|nr:two-component sensor histidine kinase [Litorihabitans aurantiacus]